MLHTDCGGCKMMFGNKDKPFDVVITSKHLDYLQLLNRGVLIFPTNVQFTVIRCGYTIFNKLCVFQIQCQLLFLTCTLRKSTLNGIIERDSTSSDIVLCDQCDTEWHTLLFKSLNCFVNALFSD